MKDWYENKTVALCVAVGFLFFLLYAGVEIAFAIAGEPGW